MQRLNKYYDPQKYEDKDVDDIINLLAKNVRCTNNLIQRIDQLIESKNLPESITKVLVTFRNTCAINVMNITQVIK